MKIFIMLVGLLIIHNPALGMKREASHDYDTERSIFLENAKKNPELLFVEDGSEPAPIHDLCTEEGYADVLEELLDQQIIDSNAVWAHPKGTQEHPLLFPLLILAVSAGAKNNAELLLKANANSNVVSRNPKALFSFCTPVLLAVETEKPAMLDLLFQYKANANMSFPMLRLPLLQAVDQRVLSNNWEALTEMIEIMIRNGADCNKIDMTGARLHSKTKGCYTVFKASDLAKERGYHDLVELFNQ